MFPNNLKPMLATSSEPFDSADFTYEIKWDGYRCIAFLDSSTRLQSRNELDLSPYFPEFANIHKRLKSSGCMIDGEIIALRNGRPSFPELQKRAQIRDLKHLKSAIQSIPVIYVVFDLLFYDYEPIFHKTIEERREKLAKNIAFGDEIVLAEFIETNGMAYFGAISELGLEGVIAKKKGSSYIPGKRVNYWLKFKRRQNGYFIVCGYSINPTRGGHLSSLILGAYTLGKLKPFGMVGTGFTNNQLISMQRELERIKTEICPFTGSPKRQKNIVWVEPRAVCEVEYAELTDDGSLRHPAFKQFKPEIKPEDCEFSQCNLLFK